MELAARANDRRASTCERKELPCGLVNLPEPGVVLNGRCPRECSLVDRWTGLPARLVRRMDMARKVPSPTRLDHDLLLA